MKDCAYHTCNVQTLYKCYQDLDKIGGGVPCISMIVSCPLVRAHLDAGTCAWYTVTPHPAGTYQVSVVYTFFGLCADIAVICG